MNVTRFEPWGLFDLLQRDLDGIVGRRLGPVSGFGDGSVEWIPAVDVVEEKDRFVLRADLPGVNPDEIEISTEKNVLTLSGERRESESSEENGLKRIERIGGRFRRRFTLPETVDAERIAASSSNGILEVSIPKQQEIQPRRIAVQAA